MWLSQTDYARHRKVSQRYIARLIRSGAIPQEALKRVGKRIQVHQIWADEALAGAVLPATERKSGLTFDKARTRALQARNKLNWAKIEEMEAGLLKSSEVKEIAEKTAERVRAKFFALPEKIGAEIAEESSEVKIRDLLKETFQHALLELVSEDLL